MYCVVRPTQSLGTGLLEATHNHASSYIVLSALTAVILGFEVH